VGSDDPAKMERGNDGSYINIYPTKKLRIPVDINLVKQNGTVNASDSVLSEINFDMPKNYLFKNDLGYIKHDSI
jgi:hypothetical protein